MVAGEEGEVWGQKQWIALFRGGQMKFCLLSEASHHLGQEVRYMSFEIRGETMK